MFRNAPFRKRLHAKTDEEKLEYPRGLCQLSLLSSQGSEIT